MYKYLIIVSLVVAFGAGCDNSFWSTVPTSNVPASTSPTSTEPTALVPTSTDAGKVERPLIDMTVPSGPVVDMSDRGLTSLPSELFDRTDIERLDLSNNQLTGSLPSEMNRMQKLKFLDISNNQMTALPAELGQLKNLEVLNAANNKLTGLPLELGNLNRLQLLDLSGNNYSQFDLDKIEALLTRVEIRK
ncbi:MAG: leucine-rich repeat domain-containing protein [Patescibacteria group bacterium]|nr:leucine-rich repeat domain-containing protein [Patescibacteria group bacterium]